MEDENPSIYFEKVINNKSIFDEYPFTLLSRLVDTEQSPQHHPVGAELCKDFLAVFITDDEFIKQVTALVRWHMQTLFVIKDLPFGDIKSMASEISIKEIALLSQSDRLGRGEMNSKKIKEEKENIKTFIRKCEHYLPSSK